VTKGGAGDIYKESKGFCKSLPWKSVLMAGHNLEHGPGVLGDGGYRNRELFELVWR
jgi:hypothetical protein